MRNAKPADNKRIVEILALAFDKNKSVRYICGNGDSSDQRVRLLMEYAINVCSTFGKVYISEDRNSCALVLFPDKKNTSIKSIGWDLGLALKVIGLPNVFKVIERESMIKKYHPHKPFYYLWFIGVHPAYQGMGKGCSLLKEIIKDAKKMKRSIYLETSVTENLRFYRRFGFEVIDELDFGYKLFIMNNLALNDF